MKKILFVFIFGIILFSGMFFVSADQNCYEDYPPGNNLYEYYGKVYYDGSVFVEPNFKVIALINDEQVGFGEIDENGNYTVEVTKCQSITSGKIDFFVGDAYATNSKDWDKYKVPEGIIGKPLDLYLNKYPNASCGNGKIDGADECDDGNTDSEDGCSEICEVEIHWTCKKSPSECTLLEYCGDGIINNGETCSSCSEDVGTCIPLGGDGDSNSGGGGGGGGGGGSPSTTLNPINTSADQNSNENTKLDSSTDVGIDEGKTKKGITGLSVSEFAGTKAGKGIIILLVLVVLGFAIYLIGKKKNS